MADHCGYNGRCPGPSFYYLFFFTLYNFIFHKDPKQEASYIQKACEPEGSFKEPPDHLVLEIHQQIFHYNKTKSDCRAFDRESKATSNPHEQHPIAPIRHSSVSRLIAKIWIGRSSINGSKGSLQSKLYQKDSLQNSGQKRIAQKGFQIQSKKNGSLQLSSRVSLKGSVCSFHSLKRNSK